MDAKTQKRVDVAKRKARTGAETNLSCTLRSFISFNFVISLCLLVFFFSSLLFSNLQLITSLFSVFYL